MVIRIVRARSKDTREILNLDEKVWKEALNLTDVCGKYDLGAYIQLGLVLIAKDGEKIIGAIITHATMNGEVFVNDWFVDKKYRGKGVGKLLYNRLIEDCKNKPLITFIDPRYKESLKFHLDIGFKIKKKVRDIYGLGEKADYYVLVKK